MVTLVCVAIRAEEPPPRKKQRTEPN